MSEFKLTFSHFKQHYTYFYTHFHILFHQHIFQKITNNNSQTILPNTPKIFVWWDIIWLVQVQHFLNFQDPVPPTLKMNWLVGTRLEVMSKFTSIRNAIFQWSKNREMNFFYNRWQFDDWVVNKVTFHNSVFFKKGTPRQANRGAHCLERWFCI